MNRNLPPRYKARLEAILQKTYDEHGVKRRPWGIKPDGNCSYTEGCAIGVSMSQEVAETADNAGYGFIRALLTHSDAAGVIAEDLFGTRDLPPENVLHVLLELQNIHDNFATSENNDEDRYPDYRAAYREELEKSAELWGLKLTPYDWATAHE